MSVRVCNDSNMTVVLQSVQQYVDVLRDVSQYLTNHHYCNMFMILVSQHIIIISSLQHTIISCIIHNNYLISAFFCSMSALCTSTSSSNSKAAPLSRAFKTLLAPPGSVSNSEMHRHPLTSPECVCLCVSASVCVMERRCVCVCVGASDCQVVRNGREVQ
jgi:hypothetical protein